MNTVLQFPTNTGGDDVIKADCDQGYTKVANTLLDKLCEADLNGRQFKIVNSIMRKTFGFGKSEDWISYEQLAEITKIDQTNISKVVNSLIKKNVIKKSGSKLSINTVISEWADSSNKVKNDSKKVKIDFDNRKSKTTSMEVKNDFALVKNDFEESQKRLPQKKETITKENTTKETGQSCQIAEPKSDSKKKTNFDNFKNIFNECLPRAKQVKVMTDSRKNLIKKLIKNYGFTEERWRTYLEFINSNSEFDWMFEERQRQDGTFWKVKGIEFIASENCYAMVKESGE